VEPMSGVSMGMYHAVCVYRCDLLDSYGMRLQKMAIPLQLEKYQVTVEGRFHSGGESEMLASLLLR